MGHSQKCFDTVERIQKLAKDSCLKEQTRNDNHVLPIRTSLLTPSTTQEQEHTIKFLYLKRHI